MTLVYNKEIEPSEFMMKLENYTIKSTNRVLKNSNMGLLLREANKVKEVYTK